MVIPILDLDHTYKVQTEAEGIAQVVGMARDFAGGAPLVVVLADNIFEFAQSAALGSGRGRKQARIFVKDVDDPENFGVVVYGENGGVMDIVEKAGVVERATTLRLVGRGRRPLLLPARRVRRHRPALGAVVRAASSRSRT